MRISNGVTVNTWIYASFHGFPDSVLQGPCKSALTQTGRCECGFLKLQRWPANKSKVRTAKGENKNKSSPSLNSSAFPTLTSEVGLWCSVMRQRNKHRKADTERVVISFVVSKRQESFFHITSMSELTLFHPVGSPCGWGKVPQPGPKYGPVHELNSLSRRSTSEVTGLLPVCAHGQEKFFVMKKLAILQLLLLMQMPATNMINMFVVFKNSARRSTGKSKRLHPAQRNLECWCWSLFNILARESMSATWPSPKSNFHAKFDMITFSDFSVI